MKALSIIFILLICQNSFAQSNSDNGKMPRYSIHLTTMNDNVFKGLLLLVKDSSVWVYPGNRKKWKTDVRYKPVEFVYSRIQGVMLKRESSALKKMLMGGSSSKTFQINGNEMSFIEFKKLLQ